MNAREKIAEVARIPIEVEAQLDRRSLTVGEILALAEGDVVKLERSAGENIDLLAGGVRFAWGEIVILGERLGVRVTDLRSEG